MRSFNEWVKNKKNVDFMEYTAGPVTSSQKNFGGQQEDPNVNQRELGNENLENEEPTEKDKLIYKGEMQGQLGTFLNLMQRSMYQRQQIFKRPAMLGLFLQDMLKLAVQLSQNPSLVNRILLKLRADVSGTDVTNMTLTPDIERGMNKFGKGVDPNTGKVVSANSLNNKQF